MTKEELQQVDLNSILLIDIREDDELEVIPSPEGAVHMPMSRVIEEVTKGSLSKDKKIVTICRSGGRCQVVNNILTDYGYQSDYLEGGVMGLQ